MVFPSLEGGELEHVLISEFHEAGRSVVQGQLRFHKKFDKSHLGSETLSLMVPAYNLSTNENEVGGL